MLDRHEDVMNDNREVETMENAGIEFRFIFLVLNIFLLLLYIFMKGNSLADWFIYHIAVI